MRRINLNKFHLMHLVLPLILPILNFIFFMAQTVPSDGIKALKFFFTDLSLSWLFFVFISFLKYFIVLGPAFFFYHKCRFNKINLFFDIILLFFLFAIGILFWRVFQNVLLSILMKDYYIKVNVWIHLIGLIIIIIDYRHYREKED